MIKNSVDLFNLNHKNIILNFNYILEKFLFTAAWERKSILECKGNYNILENYFRLLNFDTNIDFPRKLSGGAKLSVLLTSISYYTDIN